MATQNCATSPPTTCSKAVQCNMDSPSSRRLSSESDSTTTSIFTAISTESTSSTESVDSINILQTFDKTAGPYGEATECLQSVLKSIGHIDSLMAKLAAYGVNPQLSEGVTMFFNIATKRRTRAAALITRCAEMERLRIDYQHKWEQIIPLAQLSRGRQLGDRVAAAINPDDTMGDDGLTKKERSRLKACRKHWLKKLSKQEKKDYKALDKVYDSMVQSYNMFNLVQKEGYSF